MESSHREDHLVPLLRELGGSVRPLILRKAARL